MTELPKFEGKDISADIAVDFSKKFTAGGYSDVYQGTWAAAPGREPLPVAVKIPRYTTRNVEAMQELIRDIKAEISLWGQLSHPNILPFLGLYRDERAPLTIPGAVSPWCDGGTIVEYVQSARVGRVPRIDRSVQDDSFSLVYLEIELLSQATKGLAYLHERNIVHGDLKGCNILVHNGTAQLADFGYSVGLDERSSSTSSHLGTHRWFAPESLQPSAHRAPEADIWALGCVVMEVRTLDLPWASRKDAAVPTALAERQWPYACPRNINGKLWHIVAECWLWDRKARPTSKELCARLEQLINSLRIIHKAYSSSLNIRPNELTSERPTFIALSLLSFLLSQVTRYQNEPDSAWQMFTTLSAVREVTTALNGLGDRYPRKVMRRLARAIASADRGLAEQIMSNLSSAEVRAPLCGHRSPVISVAFLPDGRRLVSVSEYKTLRIWDIETGKTVIGPLVGHTGAVHCVAVNGSRIASCSWDGTFRVWDADSGELVLGPITAHHGKRVNSIAYSRDGTRIATAGYDKRAAVWDATTGVQLREMVGHAWWVMYVTFSEDGTRLVSGSKDTTVRIWDVASGRCIGEPLTGHTGPVRAVCFSRDGRHVFSSSDDSTIRIWDAETRGLIVEPDAPVLCMVLSPDGNRLVSGSSSGKIAMWDAQTGAAIPTPFKDHTATVLGVAFSPDGRTIASASEDRTITLWDATDDWKRWDMDDQDVEQDDD